MENHMENDVDPGDGRAQEIEKLRAERDHWRQARRISQEYAEEAEALYAMLTEKNKLRRYGPKTNPGSGEPPCPACMEPFVVGDFTTLISLGPAADPEQREKAREGRPYDAAAIEVHWACATGEE